MLHITIPINPSNIFHENEFLKKFDSNLAPKPSEQKNMKLAAIAPAAK